MTHKGYLKLRILIIFFLGIFFLLFILGRALQLQLIPNKKLGQLASRQYKTAVTLFPKRGTLYDRKMNELAVSRKVGSIYANPKKIKRKKGTARKLSRLTGVSFAKVYKKLRSKRSFVWIKRLVRDSMTRRLVRKPIQGVGILYEYKRFYPNQEVAGQVLGVVGVDSQGIEGLEYSYNDVLNGKKKSLVLIRDARGRAVTFDQTLFMESQEGKSLILSLDKSLQFLVERELEAFIEDYQAKKGLVLVQDVHSGEILAMAHKPFFNPNRQISYKGDIWKNRSITNNFEPGSTFKIFLSALALEKGIKPKDRFFCENGFYQVSRNASVREAQNHKFGWLSFRDILKFSSNIGAVKIAERLGKKGFHKKILQFGFGQKTSIGGPGEALGIIRPLDSWTAVDLSNIAFGQGISVTAIQLISAMSAIANGGNLLRPTLIKSISDPTSGESSVTKPKVIRRVMAPSSARRLTRMLTRVTGDGGTGFLAGLSDYKVAGKTGTAQKPNLKIGGYWPDKYVSTFLGFFPADRPKYSIFVMLDEPKKYYYASQVAAPLFKAVALHTLHMYPLKSKVLASEEMNKANVLKRTQFPQKKKKDLWNLELGQMPDLYGRSAREVLGFAHKAGLKIKVKGHGVVVSQSIPRGTLIRPGQTCMVSLKAPSEIR